MTAATPLDDPDHLASAPVALDALLLRWAEQASAGRAAGGLAPAELDRPLDWAEVATLAGRAAAYLAARDVGPGDRIAVWGQTSLAWAVWLAAAAWRGAALVAVHPNLGEAELVAALRQTRPAWLFADAAARGVAMAETAEAAGRAAGLRGTTVMPGADGRFDLDAILDAAPAPPPQGSVEAPLNIQFTSGSTGRPKAVVLSHRALVANAALTAGAAGIRRGDRIAAPLPLFHSAGLSTGLILSLVRDATWVGFHRFQTETVLDRIVADGCTVLEGVPTIYANLLDRMAATGTATPTLRVGIAGGAFLPPELCARAVREMGLDHMGMVYGQTEFAPTIAVTRGDEPADLAFTTAGPPLPGVAVRIVDPETGADAGGDAVGEIWVRGPTLMSGYFDDPEATAAAVTPDGWLRTGDLGRLVGGCLRVTARLKELIIRGGENVSPYEVEDALRAAPGVADACVVPAPSAHWGEEIHAVLAPGADGAIDIEAVRAHAEAALPRHMRPDSYETREALPLLPNGKVDRVALKDAAAGGARP